jgi:hypothetical protein
LSLTTKGRNLLAAIPDMDGESLLVQALASMRHRERADLQRLLRAFVAGLEGAAEWVPEFRPVREKQVAGKRGRAPAKGKQRVR